MENLQLMRKGDSILRILKIKGEEVLVIDCLKRTMPVWVAAAEVDGYVEIDEEELYKATGIYPVDIEELDAERRRIAYQRFTLIMGVLPRIGDDVERNHAISNAAEFFGKSKETVRMHLCRYLAFQSISALAPCKPEQEKVLSEDQKNMRWALNKFFYTSKRLSLPMAYTLMLKERYCDPEGKLLPDRPSYYQFRYFFRKHRKMQNYLVSRNGLTDYQRNSRPLLGDGVQEFAPAPGTAMLDSTILDIYLVDDAKRLIGRPILSAATDAYSGVCLGYSLSFEAGVYSLRMLLRNVLEDKADHCRKHGIRILSNSWNVSGVLPGTIVTDKGSDYASQCFSQLAELGVTIINLPAYRPELKGPIEKFFDCIQSLYKPMLKGRGVIDPDYQERGAHDYRKDACLTLEEFEKILIQCIVYYNSHRVLESFPYTEDMLEKQIQPYASAIWNYGCSLPGTNLIPVSTYRLMLTLLPRTEGRFTRTGLVANGMEYDVPTVCKYLNVVMEGNKPALGDSDYYDDLDIGSDFNGADIQEFLESLGYDFEFEGQQGRFGSNGVYFIRADRKKAPKGDAADQLKWKDPEDFTAEDLIDIDALVEAYKKYLMTVRGYDAVDAAIAATDMQNPYECEYVLQDYYGDYTIDGIEYEVRECWTDMTVCGFYYLADISKFRFFMLIMMEDLADRKVSTYCDARKKYVLEPCAD